MAVIESGSDHSATADDQVRSTEESIPGNFDPNVSVTTDAINKANQAYFDSIKRAKQPPTKTTEGDLPEMILPVKQFNQWDSETDEGMRMCGSSAMSMLVHFLAPGLIPAEKVKQAGFNQLDDYYLKELIEARGDNTNNPYAHLRVLTELGFRVELRKNLTFADIDRQLQQGIPVPMPINHHGPSSSPDKERWHWILCVGKSENQESKAHVYNDPFGELDNKNGGYRMGDGARMQYSDANMLPRWHSDGPGQGWGMMISLPLPKVKSVVPVEVASRKPSIAAKKVVPPANK